jgi:uroporphyrinogen-III decarboxylase
MFSFIKNLFKKKSEEVKQVESKIETVVTEIKKEFTEKEAEVVKAVDEVKPISINETTVFTTNVQKVIVPKVTAKEIKTTTKSKNKPKKSGNISGKKPQNKAK